MNQSYLKEPYYETDGKYLRQQPVIAPQFPQQVQVPTPAGAAIPMYPTAMMPGVMPGMPPTAPPVAPGVLPLEQSYIENILRLNLGKVAKVYMTFENNPEWPTKVFRGILDEAGRDHIILRDPETRKGYLLLMVNLDYVEFDQPVHYVPPQFPSVVQPPR